ncbi:unnamed protein product [Prorocentrum cordatum]|uniref:Subtilisin n=1 Tax=Prorocentrum cordatum TaxID=2364126 RepID=A0ABN9WLT5_9DINO|nr:unnamed protein product [Polarella glacialis]
MRVCVAASRFSEGVVFPKHRSAAAGQHSRLQYRGVWRATDTSIAILCSATGCNSTMLSNASGIGSSKVGSASSSSATAINITYGSTRVSSIEVCEASRIPASRR